MSDVREHPKAPHNQVFNITGKPTKKLGWWNPKSPFYFVTKGQKVAKKK